MHKLLIVVELLLGEIPDRLQFRQPSLKRSLMPYFLLTQGKAGPPRACQTPWHCGLWCTCPFASSDLSLPSTAVRTGNLAKFNQVLDQFGEKFQADGTYTLIIRLRHNVIKTGMGRGRWESRTQTRLPAETRIALRVPEGSVGSVPCRPTAPPLPGVRMISLSYSRISLADIAQKLQLDSPEDAEFIVAKVGLVQGPQLSPSCLPSGDGNGGKWPRRGMGRRRHCLFRGASRALRPGSCQRVRSVRV